QAGGDEVIEVGAGPLGDVGAVRGVVVVAAAGFHGVGLLGDLVVDPAHPPVLGPGVGVDVAGAGLEAADGFGGDLGLAFELGLLVDPADFEVGQEAGGWEAGAQDEHVGLVVGAGGVDEAGFGDRGDRVRHQAHVGQVEGGGEGGGRHRAFAAHG